ncbi:HdeD family acid-resistance protein [Haladaptatus sp. CMAA 1911]|uniref:HdeD family acid-resistance protein n=1 Tax=unclassified Haladaptatus TaxID=2622732 RepID=UPI003754933E
MSQATSVDTSSEQFHGGVIAGAIIVVLGVLAILFPFFAGISISVLFGALLVVGGIVHVGHAFSAGSFWGVIWQILLGILYGIVGIMFLANPVVGLTSLTILAIAFFIVDGVLEIGWAVTGRGNRRWMWLLASGILSLIVAGLLWVGFPATAVWAVGLLLGVNLLFTGFSMVMLGRATRKTNAEEPSADERGQEA